MRDLQLQLQTPQRDRTSSTRQLKSLSELNKNPQKVTRKSLNPAFKAVSDEDSVVLESLKEISEVSDDDPFGESAENFIALVKPADAYSSETVAIPDLCSPAMSSSSVITSDKHEVIHALDAQVSNPELDFLRKIGCIEAELVIKHLSATRIHVLNSKDMGPSKKLLDALINIVIDEFYDGVYDKREWLDKLVSSRAYLVLLSFMIGIFAIFMSWIFSSDANAYDMGPTPT